MYYNEIQIQILHNFPTLTKVIQDDFIISQTNNKIILNHLTALSNEFKRFQDLRGIKNCITSTTQLAALIVSDYSKLFDEFIELKNDWDKFGSYFQRKEKRIKEEYI